MAYLPPDTATVHNTRGEAYISSELFRIGKTRLGSLDQISVIILFINTFSYDISFSDDIELRFLFFEFKTNLKTCYGYYYYFFNLKLVDFLLTVFLAQLAKIIHCNFFFFRRQ